MKGVLKYHALILAVIVGRLFFGATAAPAQGFSEYDIKAAFLYNFGKFVQWPANTFASTNAPMTIGIYGDDPFHGNLASVINGRSINGHAVVSRPVTFNELKTCQILFICASEQKNIDGILKELDDAGVLTVTENLDPFKSGVMINFVLQNDQIRFEINDAAARRVGLKISSKLLILATRTTMSQKNPENQALLCASIP